MGRDKEALVKVKVTVQGHRLTKGLKFNNKIRMLPLLTISYHTSLPHLATLSTRRQSNDNDIELKELPDADSIEGGVLRKT